MIDFWEAFVIVTAFVNIIGLVINIAAWITVNRALERLGDLQ